LLGVIGTGAGIGSQFSCKHPSKLLTDRGEAI